MTVGLIYQYLHKLQYVLKCLPMNVSNENSRLIHDLFENRLMHLYLLLVMMNPIDS